MGHLPNSCTTNANYNKGKVNGALCPASVELLRFPFNGFSPSSLEQKRARFTTIHGTSYANFRDKSTTHAFGWTALLLANADHKMEFENAEQITNISFNGKIYDLKVNIKKL